jgi:hypothetical protein
MGPRAPVRRAITRVERDVGPCGRDASADRLEPSSFDGGVEVFVPGDGSRVIDSNKRIPAGAALIALGTSLGALVVARIEDVTTQAELGDYLERAGGRLFFAWILFVLSGLAWLVFVVEVRRLLPSGGARDLFVAAAVAGQAASWVGASLATAAAPSEAHDIPLSVYNAFGEAAHLAQAGGTAALGVSLVAAATAARRSAAPALLPRWFRRVTLMVGVILVPVSVIGPVALPLTWLWLIVVAVLLIRRSRQDDRPLRAGHPTDVHDCELPT